MSTHKTHYLIIGNKFGYDEFFDRIQAIYTGFGKPYEDTDGWRENVEELYTDSAFDGITNRENITIIADDYNGNYVYVGFVLQKSDCDGRDQLDDYVATTGGLNNDDIGDCISKIIGFTNDVANYHAFSHYR